MRRNCTLTLGTLGSQALARVDDRMGSWWGPGGRGVLLLTVFPRSDEPGTLFRQAGRAGGVSVSATRTGR